MNITFRGLQYVPHPKNGTTEERIAFLEARQQWIDENQWEGRNAAVFHRNGYDVRATDLHAIVLNKASALLERERELRRLIVRLQQQAPTPEVRARREAAYQPLLENLREFSETLYPLITQTLSDASPPPDEANPSGYPSAPRFQGLQYTYVSRRRFRNEQVYDALCEKMDSWQKRQEAKGRTVGLFNYDPHHRTFVEDLYIVKATDEHGVIVQKAHDFSAAAADLLQSVHRLRDLTVEQQLGRRPTDEERRPAIKLYMPLFRKLHHMESMLRFVVAHALAEGDPPKPRAK